MTEVKDDPKICEVKKQLPPGDPGSLSIKVKGKRALCGPLPVGLRRQSARSAGQGPREALSAVKRKLLTALGYVWQSASSNSISRSHQEAPGTVLPERPPIPFSARHSLYLSPYCLHGAIRINFKCPLSLSHQLPREAHSSWSSLVSRITMEACIWHCSSFPHPCTNPDRYPLKFLSQFSLHLASVFYKRQTKPSEKSCLYLPIFWLQFLSLLS